MTVSIAFETLPTKDVLPDSTLGSDAKVPVFTEYVAAAVIVTILPEEYEDAGYFEMDNFPTT